MKSNPSPVESQGAKVIQLASARKAPCDPVAIPCPQLSERDSRKLEGLWNSIEILENTAAACRAKIAEIMGAPHFMNNG